MHNKMCKMVLGVHSKASNLAVKGELGRYPLRIIIYTRIFESLNISRLLSLPNNKILNSALETNIHLDDMGKHSWFTTIKHLLCFTKLDESRVGLSNLDSFKISFLVKSFKKNLQDQFKVYWLEVVNKDIFNPSNDNKLNLYLKNKN